MMIQKRLNALREIMESEHVSMYIVPTSDFHSSEYVGDYFRAREFMSGFTGSAGVLLVEKDHAGLWTDGRYFLQAEMQLKDSGIELFKMRNEGVPTVCEYIKAHLKTGETLGFDGRVFSVAEGKEFDKIAADCGAKISCEADLVDRIWTDRPSISEKPVILHDISYTGESSEDKLKRVREAMSEVSADAHVLTSLDDIAWLLNLRGDDVECNPVFLSYLVVYSDRAVLYASPKAFSNEAVAYLKSLGVELRSYDSIYGEADSLLDSGAKVLISENKLNYRLYSLLKDRYQIINKPNPSTHMKACKNSVEQENLRQVNIRDGVAMVRFLCWLDSNIGKTPMTEMSVSRKLEDFRSEGKDFMGISFDTIAGYNAHGAIIHYEPTAETDVELKPEGFLLVDSGAQYLGGTTDITRTIALGELSYEMKHHYTMTLRGNLGVASARFPEGMAGCNLDILARRPFWDEALDYNHGTGHGVGYFLNVHEGPQNLHWSTRRSAGLTPFEEGMVITDEPGIYIEGKYGIRIENDLLVHKDVKNDYAQFMSFETLTLCPIDLRPVIREEMTEQEISVLNDYHRLVWDKLSPFLSGSELDWLRNATKQL